jgi:hypothetical protein
MEPITKTNSFIKGAVRNSHLGYVVCSKDRLVVDKVPHSIFVAWNRGEFGDIVTKNWYTAGVCIIEDQAEHMLAVSEYGDVIVFGSGENFEEEIDFIKNYSEIKVPLRGVRSIDNIAYVVGMNRQVYKRSSRGVWRSIAQEITPKLDDPVLGFESIDGFSEKELYAVGWEGEIYHFNGAHWHKNDGITNLILTDVCCAENGIVYVSGQVGTLLKGRGDQWEVLDIGDFNQDIWSVTWFKGILYFATMQNVFFIDDDNKIALVEMGADKIYSAGQLNVRKNIMWSIGAKDLMAFDGGNWSRIG